ncbi:MAG TPA: LysE family translocator [Caulobacteraceae bacterium]
MTLAQSLIAFTAAAAIITVTPGMDTALVLRTAAVGGVRRGMAAAFGIGLGCLAWGASVALGLGALIAASHPAYAVLRWAGAAYLAWLGLNLLIRPRDGLASLGDARSGGKDSSFGALRRGLATNMLNPKVGVFYVSFLPVFVPAGYSVAPFLFLLAAIHAIMGVAWLSLIAAATAPLGKALSRRGVVKALDRTTGCVFLGFSARLALAPA